MADSLKKFGEYLRDSRKAAGIQTQQKAVEVLAGIKHKVSQGLIAQYETGRIADPDPMVLRALAQAYGRDYTEMVLELTREKYGNLDPVGEVITDCRWRIFQAALKRFPNIGSVDTVKTELEKCQLEAKAGVVENEVILGLEGVQIWSNNFPNLEQLWIIVPDFLDDQDDRIFESTIVNLQRGTQYIYFLDRTLKENGRFEAFEGRLEQRIGKRRVKSQVKVVFLDEAELSLLATDYVIANGHLRSNAVGFQYFQLGGKPHFAVQMDSKDLTLLIDRLKTWMRQKPGNESSLEQMSKLTPIDSKSKRLA